MDHLILVLFMLQTKSIFAEFKLTVLHTNDNHARIGQTNIHSNLCSPEDIAADICYAGVARRLTKINEFRNTTENLLLLDGGDQYQGTVWFSYFRGWEGSHFMNRMGYDAMSLGNHEFNRGVEGVSTFISNATFPILSANIDASNEPVIRGKYEPSIVKIVAGERIGIIGYTVKELREVVDPRGIANLELLDEIKEVRKEAKRLKKDGVNKIIALGHSGVLVDTKLAETVEEVDLVVGAHSHTFLYSGKTPPSIEQPEGNYPIVVERESGSKALIVQAYAFGKYLGHISVSFDDDGNVVSWEGKPILLNSSIPEDPILAAEVAKWESNLLNFTSDTIGESHVHLEGDRTVCREYECNLGNLICDAALRSTNDRTPTEGTWGRASACFWNGGGIRGSIEQGPINVGHVITSFPFQNGIDLLRLNGSVLKEAFEHAVSRWGEQGGRFLQVSGFQVVYDVRKPVNERVKEIRIRCGNCIIPTFEPLQMDQIYSVVTNNFIFVGGDGFNMLEPGVKSRETVGIFEDDSIAEYFKNYSPVIHGLDGRISFYTGDIDGGPDTGCCSTLRRYLVEIFVVVLTLHLILRPIIQVY